MRSKTRSRLSPAIVIGVLIGGAAPAYGQASVDQQTLQMNVYSRTASRADLEALVEPLQGFALNAEDSDAQEELRVDLAWLSYRLREGDIWQGDVISLAVAGEIDWTADFTVTPARGLVLENIDPIPLSGVLYSELEGRIAEHLGRYLRDPRVQAEALKRIAVLGGVGNPGFMSVSGSTVIADLITLAGGPSSTADLDDAEFRRAGESIGFDTGGPIAFQAYSLDQLGIRSGDELHIPQDRSAGRSFWMDFRFLLASVTGLILLGTRIF